MWMASQILLCKFVRTKSQLFTRCMSRQYSHRAVVEDNDDDLSTRQTDTDNQVSTEKIQDSKQEDYYNYTL